MSSSPHPETLNIVLAASEAVPYAKTGGLADVAGALPLELLKLGHRVTLVIPHYGRFLSGRSPLQQVARFVISVAGGTAEVGLEEDIVPVPGAHHPLRVLAVRYDPYFDRAGLYQSSEGDYPDNLDRFVLFSRAVLETVTFLRATRGETADVLHLHDWQTALCAVYLKTPGQRDPALPRISTLLTLHNIGYQGIFPAEQFPRTGLPSSLFSLGGLEFFGSINLLKGGMVFADVVSTVSTTYAKEIITPQFGCGLEGVLAGRSEGVQGITNGIDVTVWNPIDDPYLEAHYSENDLSGKSQCKQALQRALQLPVANVPMLAVIGRLTSQKGFDLLIDILPELMMLDVQLAILGAGDRPLEEALHAAKQNYPKKIGLHTGFAEKLAHQIVAGADMLLMPSRYEPCGLTQLYGLRYGTVPIVRRTGGLADTVVPYKPSTIQRKQATGFHFMDASGDALLSAIQLARHVYKDQQTWRIIMQAGMTTDVSWTQAARRYVELYRWTMSRANPGFSA